MQKRGFQTRHLNKSNKANYTHIWKRDTNNLCLQNKFIWLLLAKRFLHSDNSRKILAVLWVRLPCQETQGIIPWKVKHSKIWAAAQHATRSSRSPPRAGSNTGCQHSSSSSPVCVLLIATSQWHACVMATRFVPGCISVARTTLTSMLCKRSSCPVGVSPVMLVSAAGKQDAHPAVMDPAWMRELYSDPVILQPGKKFYSV